MGKHCNAPATKLSVWYKLPKDYLCDKHAAELQLLIDQFTLDCEIIPLSEANKKGVFCEDTIVPIKEGQDEGKAKEDAPY